MKMSLAQGHRTNRKQWQSLNLNEQQSANEIQESFWGRGSQSAGAVGKSHLEVPFLVTVGGKLQWKSLGESGDSMVLGADLTYLTFPRPHAHHIYTVTLHVQPLP